jgi:hypothetical protein
MARIKSINWVLRNLNHILKERHRIQHLVRKKEYSDDNLLFIHDKKKTRSSNLLIRKRLLAKR